MQPFSKGPPTSPFVHFWKELLTELNVTPTQLHPNSWAFIRAFIIQCAQFDILPSVEVFLYFFEAKHVSTRPWVSVNGAPGRALLTIFQSSYKNFEGKFVKVWASIGVPTLLDGFPMYWTPDPNFGVLDAWKSYHPKTKGSSNSLQAWRLSSTLPT